LYRLANGTILSATAGFGILWGVLPAHPEPKIDLQKMLLSIGLIILGMAMLVAGGETLLRGAVGLATLLRLTPAVIGLTVVAAGTSVPELAVSGIAAFRGNPDIAVGNVVGSNIFNFTFIVGMAALVRPLMISGNTTRLEYPVLAIVTLLCLVVARDGEIQRIDAALFILIYVAFTAYLVRLVRRQMNPIEVREMSDEVAELAQTTKSPAKDRPRASTALLLVAVGSALLGFGAQATVAGAEEIAKVLGLSDRIIGLTVVSIGTGLPEAVTSLVSSVRGRDDVAIGNVIGSNLFNILGILGISGAIAPVPVHPEIIASDMWWMLGATFIMFPLMYTGSRINRWEGALLLVVYGSYLTFLLRRPE
jgi:cation:H+ antiporter